MENINKSTDAHAWCSLFRFAICYITYRGFPTYTVVTTTDPIAAIFGLLNNFFKSQNLHKAGPSVAAHHLYQK
jgi:hypothetical protein